MVTDSLGSQKIGLFKTLCSYAQIGALSCDLHLAGSEKRVVYSLYECLSLIFYSGMNYKFMDLAMYKGFTII